jgi:hypothetical protein
MPETWNRGDSQESMVTTHSSGHMETENFRPNIYPFYKKCRYLGWSRDWGKDQAITRPNDTHSMSKHHLLTPLIIICYACRQDLSIFLWGSTQQLTQTDTDIHNLDGAWGLFFFFNIFFYYVFSSITFPMLSQKSPIPSPPLPYPPIPTFWPWHSPVLGHIKFASSLGTLMEESGK